MDLPNNIAGRAVFFVLLCCLAFSPNMASGAAPDHSGSTASPESAADRIEKGTGLKKLSGDKFILDLKYASEDNFLKKDVYSPFGLNACYVHPEAYEMLQELEGLLEKENLRLVIFDCYRPLEVQKAMWEIMPDGRYVANPAKGSLHNRGIAIDCALADENGKLLEFPTPFDSFSETAWQAYECPGDVPAPCANREKLNSLMREVGFRTIRTEWWHFQLPDARKYPLLSIEGGVK